MDDLFILEGLDGGRLIDLPWHLAKFLSSGAKGTQMTSKIQGAHFIGRIARSLGLMTPNKLARVTISKGTSLTGVGKLIEYNICIPNGIGGGDLIPEIQGGASGAGGSQAGKEERKAL